MPFLQLTFTVGADDPSPFEDALLACGALSITLEDAADDPVLEPAPGTTPLWPSVRIKALFEAAADPDILTLLLGEQLTSPLPPLEFAALADRIWEREWLKDFRPMRFGKRLWICPGGQRPGAAELEMPSPLTLSRTTGEGESDEAVTSLPSPLTLSRNTGEGKLAETVFIELDPGLAFGTGTHPTTALCLEWLDGADVRDKTVIDYGCGSGVLAIAALKLGAASAIAVDIDPQAVTATVDNAQRNQVAHLISTSTVDAMMTVPADILLANILAEPLDALAPSLSELLVAGGQLVLSGLLSAQAQQVAVRYAPWFDMAPVTVREGWARLNGVRRADVRRHQESIARC